MKAGYIQVEIDQQPYEQGFLPVMQVYLEKKVGLAPADIDSGEAVFTPEQADQLMGWPNRAFAEPIDAAELRRERRAPRRVPVDNESAAGAS